VGTLVLTHLVPAPVPGSEHEWESEARKGFEGTVVVAHDLWQLEL
jgi:ribonuclease BN (tRNA processing enzyme)